MNQSAEKDYTAEVLEDVAHERAHQVEKGWTPEHDDTHPTMDLVTLAVRRARGDAGLYGLQRRERLVEAAAMLVAAIESIDRNGRCPRD